jgi:hypothetical protein
MEIVKRQTGILKEHPLKGISAKTQPGRLWMEIRENEKTTLEQIYLALEKASQVMGLSVDSKSLVLMAKDAPKYILEAYPLSQVEDVLKAIEYGSIGRIELKDQLHGLSARNIFQWYSAFRQQFPQEMKQPIVPVGQYYPPEPSPEEKIKLRIQAFQQWLELSDKEKELMAATFYASMIETGVMVEPEPKTKTDLYWQIAADLFQKVGAEIRATTDLPIADFKAMKEAYEANQNKPFLLGEKFKFNRVHQYLAQKCKSILAIQFVSGKDKSELAKSFENYFK